MTSTISALTTGGGGIVMSGDSSGDLSLLSGVNTVVAVTSTGATVTGTLAATGAITGSSTVAGSTGILYPLTSGTAVASTSGTSIDFTSIPSWVKRITVMFSGVSANGTSDWLIQLGDAGGVETAGYLGTGTSIQAGTGETLYTTGIGIRSTSAATIAYGSVVISQVSASSNTWVSQGVLGQSNVARSLLVGGGKALSDTLTLVRITTVNGTDTFDAGSVNILYE